MSDKVVALLDRIATAVDKRHRLMQLAMVGAFARSLEDPHASSAAVRRAFAAELRAIRVDASNDIVPMDVGLLQTAVDEVMAQVSEDLALPDEGVYPAVVGIMGESAAAIEDRVRDALRLDESTVVSARHKIVLDAEMKVASGMDRDIAMALARRRAATDLSFTHRDRSGARWNTATWTRTLVRGFLVGVHTDAVHLTLLSNGIDTAHLELRDGSLVPVALGDGPAPEGGLTIDDALEERLHPNAVRLLQR